MWKCAVSPTVIIRYRRERRIAYTYTERGPKFGLFFHSRAGAEKRKLKLSSTNGRSSMEGHTSSVSTDKKEIIIVTFIVEYILLYYF